MSDNVSDKFSREALIMEYLSRHETISNGVVQKPCQYPSLRPTTANRILRKMADAETIKRFAANRDTKYSKS